MKRTFTIKLDTEISIDFTDWGLSEAVQLGGYEARRLIINHYLDHCGMKEFEVCGKNSMSLFEAIAEVIKAQDDYFLAYIDEFGYTE